MSVFTAWVSTSAGGLKPELILGYCLLLLALISSPLRAGEPPAHALGSVDGEDWHYPLAEQESLESVGRRYLRSSEDWVDLVRYNALSDAFALPPGTIVRIPLKWLKHAPRPAVLAEVAGTVWIYRRGEPRRRAATPGVKLNVGDRIKVEEGSARVHFEDGSRLSLGPKADVDFNQLRFYGDSGMVDTRLRLRSGRIKSEVRDRVGPEGRYEIQTRDVTAAVRGTVFVLEQTEIGSRIEVLEGLITLRTRGIGIEGSEVRVSAGAGASVSSTEGISTRQLPSIAALSISRAGGADGAPAVASWSEDSSHSLVRYRIMFRGLADDQAYKLLDTGISDSNRLRLPTEADGVYRLVLQVVDKAGFRGVPQQFEFRVDSKAPRQFELRLSSRSPDRTSL
ncbi:FecR family protein [Allohahella sp. A8]|uniref:FecR family protein n=1 Tax=Allohahella sp. A8 TaxID=3141461 RepID=UPI003A7F7BF4